MASSGKEKASSKEQKEEEIPDKDTTAILGAALAHAIKGPRASDKENISKWNVELTDEEGTWLDIGKTPKNWCVKELPSLQAGTESSARTSADLPETLVFEVSVNPDKLAGRTCFQCGNKGHFARQCPHKPDA